MISHSLDNHIPKHICTFVEQSLRSANDFGKHPFVAARVGGEGWRSLRENGRSEQFQESLRLSPTGLTIQEFRILIFVTYDDDVII